MRQPSFEFPPNEVPESAAVSVPVPAPVIVPVPIVVPIQEPDQVPLPPPPPPCPSLPAAPLYPRLTRAIEEWRKITSDIFVLNVIRYGFVLPLREDADPSPLLRPPFCQRPFDQAAKDEVAAQVQLGAIALATTTTSVALSPLFPVPKGPGKPPRLVWDGREVNRLLAEPPWFPLDGIHEAMTLLRPGDWMSKVDIKSAFSHVPVHPASRRWLGFHVEGTTYLHRSLPFGLNWSPFVWTRVLGVALNHLRREGIVLLAYVDDILLVHPDQETLKSQVESMLTLFRQLDILPNLDKSVLTPTRTMTFLGFVLDTQDWRISIQPEKIDPACALAKRVQSELPKGSCTVRRLAAITGTIASFLPAIPSLRRRLLPLHRLLFCSLDHSQDYSRRIDGHRVHDVVLRVLDVLRLPETFQHREPIATPFPTVALFTDASDLGWGACLLHHDQRWETAQGLWNNREMALHINVKEAIAWARGVQQLVLLRKPARFTSWVDSTVLLAHLQKTRAGHHPSIQDVVLPVLEQIHQFSIWMDAAWLPTEANRHADALSRNQPLPLEAPSLPPRPLNPVEASSFQIALFLQRKHLSFRACPDRPSFADAVVPAWQTAFWSPLLAREATILPLPPPSRDQPARRLVLASWHPWRISQPGPKRSGNASEI